jgi:hypothetical protein
MPFTPLDVCSSAIKELSAGKRLSGDTGERKSPLDSLERAIRDRLRVIMGILRQLQGMRAG